MRIFSAVGRIVLEIQSYFRLAEKNIHGIKIRSQKTSLCLSMKIITPSDLSQFTGTTQYYRHWTKRLLYTDGVQYFAERAGT